MQARLRSDTARLSERAPVLVHIHCAVVIHGRTEVQRADGHAFSKLGRDTACLRINSPAPFRGEQVRSCALNR